MPKTPRTFVETFWFSVVAAVILGPLLRPGLLLLLDLPVGPRPAWPPLFPTPSYGLVSPGTMSAAFVRVIAGLVSSELQNQTLIVLVVVVGGILMARACRTHFDVSPAASVGAGTLFVVNPFVEERVLMGQLVLVLDYSLLPLMIPMLATTVASHGKDGATKAIAAVAAISLVEIHVGGMALLLFVVATMFAPIRRRLKLLRSLAAAAVTATVHMYWVLPVVLEREYARLGSGDLAAYAPRPRGPGILPHVLLLHGGWREEFPAPLETSAGLFLVGFLPIIAVAIYGIWKALGSHRSTRLGAIAAVACLVGVILGMGTSFPLTAWVTQLLYDYLPGYGIYREPQKWVGLVAFGYSIFFGLGLHELGRRLPQSRRVQGLVAACAILPLLAASGTMLWGFGGRLQTSEFPRGWHRADALTGRDEGKLLFLPWNLYQPLPFAGNRTIASPADRFFEMPVLVSRDAALRAEASTRPADPRDRYIASLLRAKGRFQYFGHLVAPLDVHYVALADVADASDYGFLDRQRDLVVRYSDADITVYQNLSWRGDIFPLDGGSRVVEDVLRSPPRQREVVHSFTSGLADGADHPPDVPDLLASLVPSSRVSAPPAEYMGTGLSCLDGWTLNGTASECHLGAVAAFEDPPASGMLSRPAKAFQIIGYAVSAIALILIAMTILRRESSARTAGSSREPRG